MIREQYPRTGRLLFIAALVIAGTILTMYHPSIKIGLAGDDVDFVAWANTMSLPEYLKGYLDPRTPIHGWYRPMFGVYYRIQSTFFGLNSSGYHLIWILQHVANALIFFAIIAKYSKNWRLGFLSSLVYAAAIPTYSQAVTGIGGQDALMTTFYLLCVWAWLRFRLDDKQNQYYRAVVFFLLALLTKEPAIMILPTLFCVDQILGIKTSASELVRRYSVFFALTIPYLIIEYSIHIKGGYVQELGYGPGTHMLDKAATYIAVLAFPWQVDWSNLIPIRIVAGATLAVAIIAKRSLAIFLLAVIAVINLLPITALRLITFEPRYIYLSLMVVAIFVALGLERGVQLIRAVQFRIGAAAALALLILGSGIDVAHAADQYDWFIRQRRVPFRDISQRHPTFPDDTFLYFINPPFTPVRDLRSMFALRYGSKVSVGPLSKEQIAGWRDHNAAYVYYFDETGRAYELSVDKHSATQTFPTPPVDFEIPVRLEGFEVTQNQLRRGESLVLILYWRARGEIEKDYTVFIHLVDEKGTLIEAFDAPPRNAERSSSWTPSQFVQDARVLTISPDVHAGGDFRLEIGLYHLPTGERALLIDPESGARLDKLVIHPFHILE